MNKLLRLFHWLSFLQFPMILMAAYNFFSPFFQDNPDPLRSVSNGMLWIGLALSFGALAEMPQESKWSVSLKKRPVLFKLWIGMLGGMILLIFSVGLVGLIRGAEQTRDLWLSLIVLGIGMLGLLRMTVEMLRKDNSADQ